ncbi:hypothetical protein DPMN_029535 [Dreissena polymorpha]|uniref:Uncharacterized protein n=1 Tax=Dreissena polymorpha TaxID=45954 RepID=A0A9D4M116_DREPO|nr:hypothetical protein DPMN_029535 [Dreissena polymorpha]
MTMQLVDAVEAARTDISVVPEGTDVLVLWLHYYLVLTLSPLVIMDSPVREEQ